MANLRLSLTARQWATIDAQMDNSAYMMREAAAARGEVSEEDMPRLGFLGLDDLPRSIRQSGSTQVPWVGPDQLWPPDDQVLSIELSDTQWQFIATELRNAAGVYEHLGDQESQRLSLDALSVIESSGVIEPS